jgi:membrane-associated phospholipid phosphatase
VLAGWPPLHRTDVSVDNQLNAWVAPRPGLTTLWLDVSDALQPLTWEVLGALAAVLLWRARRRKIAFFVLVAIFGTVAWYDIVKAAVGRARPTVPIPLLHATGASFPSGHAMMSAVAMTLAVIGAWTLVRGLFPRLVIITAAVLIAAGTAFSRLALGVHYLSDVLAGWLLGAAWVLTLLAVFDLGTSHDRSRGQRGDQARVGVE